MPNGCIPKGAFTAQLTEHQATNRPIFAAANRERKCAENYNKLHNIP